MMILLVMYKKYIYSRYKMYVWFLTENHSFFLVEKKVQETKLVRLGHIIISDTVKTTINQEY